MIIRNEYIHTEGIQGNIQTYKHTDSQPYQQTEKTARQCGLTYIHTAIHIYNTNKYNIIQYNAGKTITWHCKNTYIHTYIHTYIRDSIHTDRQYKHHIQYIHTNNTCIHRYIHTCIHTYT